MRRAVTLALVVVLLFTAGCSVREEEGPEGADPAVTPTQPAATQTPGPAAAAPTETPEPEPTEEPEPAYRSPFNGAGMEKPYSGRPFMVMINNIQAALPHRGVEQADILYEVLAEGGVTRMMAVFSDVEAVGEIGPVRSIRPYFIDLGLAYNSVIIHAGGSTEAYNRLYGGGIAYIDGLINYKLAKAFYRDQQRQWDGYAVEHTLFTTGENLYKVASDEKNYSLELDEGYETGLHFVKDGTPEDGESAEKIKISFGYKTTEANYDKDKGVYTLKQFGKNYVDETTGTQPEFTNILTIRAATYTIDSYGRLSITLNGTGSGWYACGGKCVPITWERESGRAPFHYYLEDGTELSVGAGSSYIAIIPNTSGSFEAE